MRLVSHYVEIQIPQEPEKIKNRSLRNLYCSVKCVGERVFVVGLSSMKYREKYVLCVLLTPLCMKNEIQPVSMLIPFYVCNDFHTTNG